MREIKEVINAQGIERAVELIHNSTTVLEQLDTLHGKQIKQLVIDITNRQIGGKDFGKVIETQRKEIIEVVKGEFESAEADGDEIRLSKYFKLFPRLNEERLGLDSYSKLLSQKLRESYKVSGTQSAKKGVYGLRLGNMFEAMAYLIDNNTNIVEKYYGGGSMARVIEHLQIEMDKRIVLVVESFEDSRQVTQLVGQVEGFFDKVSSHPKEAPVKETRDVAETAAGTNLKWMGVKTSQNVGEKGRGVSSELARSSGESVEEGPDMSIVSETIDELAVMASQCVGFVQYLQRVGQSLSERLVDKEKIVLTEGEIMLCLPGRSDTLMSKKVGVGHEKGLKVNPDTGILINTQLEQMTEWLVSSYIQLEKYYSRQMSLKAIQYDDLEELEGWAYAISMDKGPIRQRRVEADDKSIGNNNWQLTSSCAEDLFYVLQRGLMRAVKIQRENVMGEIIAVCADIMSNVFLEYLESQVMEKWEYQTHPSGVPGSGQGFFSGPDQPGRATTLKSGYSNSNAANSYLGIPSSRDGGTPSLGTHKTGTYTNLLPPAVNSTGAAGGLWKQSLKSSLTSSTLGLALGLGSSSSTSAIKSQKHICVGLNNLDVSVSYLAALLDSLTKYILNQWDFDDEQDQNNAKIDLTIQSMLSKLSIFSSKMSLLLSRAINRLVVSALRIRIRQALKESYSDIKYVLNDEEFSDVMANNLFVQRLLVKLHALLLPFKNRFTKNNYSQFVANFVEILVSDWQRAIVQSKFNVLGGICFEKDVKAVQHYFEELPCNYNLRSKFSRLAQMAMVLASHDPRSAINQLSGSHNTFYSLDGDGSVDESENSSLDDVLLPDEVAKLISSRIDI